MSSRRSHVSIVKLTPWSANLTSIKALAMTATFTKTVGRRRETYAFTSQSFAPRGSTALSPMAGGPVPRDSVTSPQTTTFTPRASISGPSPTRAAKQITTPFGPVRQDSNASAKSDDAGEKTPVTSKTFPDATSLPPPKVTPRARAKDDSHISGDTFVRRRAKTATPHTKSGTVAAKKTEVDEIR